MPRIVSFNADAARRIGAVVRAVERDGGGGVRRRGKFDDAADGGSIDFRLTRSTEGVTVAAGNAYWWDPYSTKYSMPVRAGYDLLYTSGDYSIAEASVALPSTGYRAVYVIVTRADRALYPASWAIAYADGADARLSVQAAMSAGAYNKYITVLGVVDSDGALAHLYEGSIYIRDDPPVGTSMLWTAGETNQPNGPSYAAPYGWEVISNAYERALVGDESGGVQTNELQHDHEYQNPVGEAYPADTSAESLPTYTVALIRKL